MADLTVRWDGKQQDVKDVLLTHGVVSGDYAASEDYTSEQFIENLVALYATKMGLTCYFEDLDANGYNLLVDGEMQFYDWLDDARDELVALSCDALEFVGEKERTSYHYTDAAGLEAVDALAERKVSAALCQLLNAAWQERGDRDCNEALLRDNGCRAVGQIGVYHGAVDVTAYAVDWEDHRIWVAYDPQAGWFDDDDDWCIEDYPFGTQTGSASFWWHIAHCDDEGDVSEEDKIAYLQERGVKDAKAMVGCT